MMYNSFMLLLSLSITSSIFLTGSQSHTGPDNQKTLGKDQLNILLPRASSVWITNGRSRTIIFSCAGNCDKSWIVKIIKEDGTLVDDYQEETVLQISEYEVESAVSLSASAAVSKLGGSDSSNTVAEVSLLYFRIVITLEKSVQPALYKVEVCEDIIAQSKVCAATEFFTVEGVSQEGYLQHEERFYRRKREKETRLTGIELEKYWPVNNTKCTVKRVHKPTKEEFDRECMNPAEACIISGAMEDWPAMRRWPLDTFQSDSRISEGIYIGDRPEMIPVRVYNDYVKNHAHLDTAPWMVFMPDVFEMYPELLEDYTVPDLFSEDDDFMMKVPDELRIDWRWIIMAPRGSGSGWHADPANTTGWLALVSGSKLWALYPPSQHNIPGVKNNFYKIRDYKMDDAFNWWIYTRPQLESALPQECVQKAGDIVFIPPGWWHAVLNLDHTVAVTQNFCNKYSIKGCIKEFKEQADSDGNFIGQTFESLRELYSDSHSEYFEEDDEEFVAPTAGQGMTFTEFKKKEIDDLKKFLSGGHEL